MIMTSVTEHLCYMLKENKWLFSAFYWFVFIHALLTVIFLICISYINQGQWFFLQHFPDQRKNDNEPFFKLESIHWVEKLQWQNSFAQYVILMVYYAIVVEFYITKHTD